jgi:hypothetical protein
MMPDDKDMPGPVDAASVVIAMIVPVILIIGAVIGVIIW